MKAMSLLSLVSITLFATTAAPTWAHDQHEGDVIVGRSASGQLKVEADIGLSLLGPVNSLFLKGWAATEPGMESLLADEPLEDFHMLAPGAQISLVGVSLDPAFKVHSPMLDYLIAAPGDQMPLGDNELHEHPTWHIDSQDPGFNPLQTVWYGTFKLVDTGTTGYAASDPFTLTFTNVPAPATLGLLAIGAVAVMRRRRHA
jgi:hypothetical protein